MEEEESLMLIFEVETAGDEDEEEAERSGVFVGMFAAWSAFAATAAGVAPSAAALARAVAAKWAACSKYSRSTMSRKEGRPLGVRALGIGGKGSTSTTKKALLPLSVVAAVVGRLPSLLPVSVPLANVNERSVPRRDLERESTTNVSVCEKTGDGGEPAVTAAFVVAAAPKGAFEAFEEESEGDGGVDGTTNCDA